MGELKGCRQVASAMVVALALLWIGGCSSAYESYMADACGGLRAMASAYETMDQDAFEAGYNEVFAYVPAGEEATGDKELESEVSSVWNAQRLLHIAAYEPAERNDGASIWRGLEISKHDEVGIEQGLETCEQY